MSERIIVISATLDGAKRAAHGLPNVVAVCSPGTLDRLRGVSADRVLLAVPFTDQERERLAIAYAPCIATSPDSGSTS